MTDLPKRADELFFVIQDLRGRGSSQREALRALRAQGRPIADKSLRAAWRRAGEIETRANRIRRSRRDFKPRESDIPLIPTAEGSLIRGRFSYAVEITGTAVSGDRIGKGENIITITSDEVRTRREIEQRAQRLITQPSRSRSGSDQMLEKGLKVRLIGVARR